MPERIIEFDDHVTIRGQITDTVRLCDPVPKVEFWVTSPGYCTAFWVPESQVVEVGGETIVRAIIKDKFPAIDLIGVTIDHVPHTVVVPRSAIVTDPDLQRERVNAAAERRKVDEIAMLRMLARKHGLTLKKRECT